MPLSTTGNNPKSQRGQRPLRLAPPPAVIRSRSLPGAIANTLQGERSRVNKLFDLLQSSQYAAAGIAHELFVRRRKGLTPRSMLRAAIRGIDDRRSFSTVTGNQLTGLLGDVVFDAWNLVPGGALVKGARAGAKVTGLNAVARAAGRVVEETRALKATKDFLGEKIVNNYLLKLGHHDEVLTAKNIFLKQKHKALVQGGEQIRNRLIELVPSTERRKNLAMLLELKPVTSVDPKILDPDSAARFKTFTEGMARLAPEEKQAFRIADKWLDRVERMKRENNLLTQERIAGFMAKTGLRYVPRRLATKDDAKAALSEMLQDAKKARKRRSTKDKALDDIADVEAGAISEARADVETIEQWLVEIDEIPEILTKSVRDRMDAYYEISKKNPRFQWRRKDKRAFSEMAKENLDEYNTDIAELLGMESKEVAKAMAANAYARELVDYLSKKGHIFAGDPHTQIGKLVTSGQMEPDVARRLISEGFERIKVKGFEGMSAPKGVVQEINRAIGSYSDPAQMDEFMSLFVKVTSWYKAWTLAPFLAYHFRNVVSNFWNNYIAGMGMTVDSMQAYHHSTVLLNKIKSGHPLSNKIIRGLGKSEQELYEEMIDNRIIKGGQFAAELAATPGTAGPKTLLTLDPSRNTWVQFGTKVGETLEEHSRMAHYLWRLQKGDSANDAAQSVFKYLFDYQYGLTPFETKAFRQRLLPFYAWTRFNIPLQLEMLVHAPKRFLRADKTQRAWEDRFGGPDPNEVFLYQFLKHQPKIRAAYDKRTGQYQYFAFSNWWPAADIGTVFSSEEAMDEFVNLLNPVGKVPLELFANYSMFKGRELEEVKGETGRVLGVSKVGPISISKRAEHLLTSWRPVGEANRVIEQWLETEGQPEMRRTLLAALRFVGRTYPVDFNKQARWWEVTTAKQIGALKAFGKRAEREGMDANVELAAEKIQELEQLRFELLGIKPPGQRRSGSLRPPRLGTGSRQLPRL